VARVANDAAQPHNNEIINITTGAMAAQHMECCVINVKDYW